ncbi:FAD-dependent oxidoreductase [Sphingobacteriales bacterium UPWRP_1]|nr:hypothetical protein B6N25_12915 [Sphingobacteriales bacterium TSM_CSS]PSJ76990.1 FAD-dependent oxidoreductase [Sphingobacteriales bacterium UPWRP_1]
MNRRTFVQRTLRTAGALLLPDLLLTACNGNNLCEVENWQGKAVVIGAGAAGMYAAQLLHKAGADVTVLEASGAYGGRIRPLNGFSDFIIELGAEEVHGNKTQWYKMVQNAGSEFTSTNTTDLLALGSQLLTEDEAANDPDVITAFNFVDSLGNYTGPDKSIAQHIAELGIPTRVHHLLNALIGNEFGSDNTRLGAKSIANAENLWTAGNDSYALKNDTLLSVLEYHCANILGKIILNQPVQSVTYTHNSVTVTTASGNVYTADKAIITIPLAVLKTGAVAFSPALPDAKTQAFEGIGMDAGMKIILRFNNRFWPEDTGSIYGNGFIPEFWSTGYGRSAQNNLLTAFICGPNAEYLSSLGDNAIQTALAELDALFGQGAASGAFDAGFIMDWFKQPYIRGAYSYPSPNSDVHRQALAQPVANTLFFAGEATHAQGHQGTVHGAIETAQRAVNELLCSLKE